MYFLNQKLKRDIFRNWTQFFSVFLMALLSVLVYVGLEGVWYGMETSVSNYVEEANLADAWLHAVEFTESDIEYISNIDSVEDISVKTRIQVSASQPDVNTYILLETLGTSAISMPTIIRGESISSEGEGIWLNLEYAEVHNLSVGNYVAIAFGGQETELKILGIIQSPTRMYFTGTTDFVAPNAQLYGYGMITERVLKEQLNYNRMPNFMELSGDGRELRERAVEILENRYISYFNRETLFEVSNALDRSSTLQRLSLLFSFIFITLSILTMYTTIKRLIDTQIQDVATLKALGYSNRMIGIHYTLYGLIVGGIGAILGALLAPLISRVVLSTQQEMFSVPNWGIAYTWSSLLVIVMVVSICSLSAFIASRNSRKGLPAVFLRGNNMKSGKAIFLEKASFLWGKLTFGSRWAWRDGLGNPVRILMGIIGVIGSMMLLMAGLGMPDSMNGQIDDSFGRDFTYTAQLTVNPLNTDEENAELYQELGGQWIQRLTARTMPDDGVDRVLTIFDDGNYIQARTLDDMPVQSEGAYLTEGFAKALNLDVGDYIRVQASLDVNEYEFEVMGFLPISTPQGIYIHVEAWENEGGDFHPQRMFIGDNTNIEQLRSDVRIEEVISMKDQRSNAEEMVENIGNIFRLIIATATLLVVVILYNLGALSFTERTRDYATLRVLGFRRKEIRKLAMRENVMTTLLGWILGIPAGYLFLEQYVATFSTYQIVYYPQLKTTSLVVASVIAVGCSLLTTLLLGRRIKRVDMVEAIKGIE